MDDRWLKTTTLVRRLHYEAENGQYYACTVLADRRVVFDPAGPKPDEPEMMFLIDMATELHQQLNHDGRWVVQLTHPKVVPGVINGNMEYGRRAFIWFDEDGDPAFTMDSVEPWHRVLQAGQLVWLQQAEMAWQGWHRSMREILDPAEAELYKKAQGQAAPSDTKH